MFSAVLSLVLLSARATSSEFAFVRALPPLSEVVGTFDNNPVVLVPSKGGMSMYAVDSASSELHLLFPTRALGGCAQDSTAVVVGVDGYVFAWPGYIGAPIAKYNAQFPVFDRSDSSTRLFCDGTLWEVPKYQAAVHHAVTCDQASAQPSGEHALISTGDIELFNLKSHTRRVASKGWAESIGWFDNDSFWVCRKGLVSVFSAKTLRCIAKIHIPPEYRRSVIDSSLSMKDTLILAVRPSGRTLSGRSALLTWRNSSWYATLKGVRTRGIAYDKKQDTLYAIDVDGRLLGARKFLRER